MALRGYYLGCPGWGMKSWVGRLFPAGTKNADFLTHYAKVFNTVEGNTTFYALPTPDIVARWRDSVPDSFRFCFKFPREVSHDKQLVDCASEVATFIDRVSPLGEKLGTLFLQLPPKFDRIDTLRAFLESLPAGFHYAVELRHEVFFAGGDEEDEVVALLRDRDVDLVMMDARGLHSGEDAEVQGRKPNLPVIMRATGSRPFVRCVPHERFEEGRHLVEPWAQQLAKWIADGKTPYFFMHAPDDTYAPENAYAFHAMLRELVDVGDLPPWQAKPQLSLF